MTPDRPIVDNEGGPSAPAARETPDLRDRQSGAADSRRERTSTASEAPRAQPDQRPGLDRGAVSDPSEQEKYELRAKEENRGLTNTIKEKAGAHPIGTAVGAVGGAAAGAVSGLAAGPVGSLVGAAAGAVLGSTGGAVGGSGPAVTAADDAPPLIDGLGVEDHRLAFNYGADAHAARNGRTWEEVEPDLAEAWERARGLSKLSWEEALPTVRQAWRELEAVTRLPDGGGRYV